MFKRYRLKVIIALFCALISALSCFGGITASAASLPDCSGAEYLYLYNFEADKLIYSKGELDKSIAPASTVKIMTGLLAIKKLDGRLDEQVTLTQEMLNGAEGFTIDLKVGDTLTVKDLLYGLICGCGNDAALALSVICSGNTAAFVEEMNAYAIELGMNSTNYTNPSGIDDAQMSTTLGDIVKLSKTAIENKLFLEISSLSNYTYTERSTGTARTLANRNALISSYSAIGYQNKKVKGLNAGATELGGYCVSAYATDGKSRYLCIAMGGKTTSNGKISSYAVTNNLLNYYFDNYIYTRIAQKGDVVGELAIELALPTNGNQAVCVDCVIEEDIYAFAPVNVDHNRELDYRIYYHTPTLTAPIYENTVVGGVDIYYGDEYIASGRLVTAERIEESSLLVILDRMKSFTLSRTVIIFILILIPSVLLYFYITVWKRKLARKKALMNELNKK